MTNRAPSTADEELCKRLPKRLPQIELHHGQAVWVMTELGFRGGVSEETFYEYLKSLRKFGIPFEHPPGETTHRALARYTYCELMELALALTLRVYHVLPDAILSGIIQHRRALRGSYQRAYLERASSRGAPIALRTEDGSAICMRGAFLDLQVNYSGGHLVSFGPPKSLSPFAALAKFAAHEPTARISLPINLSFLAEKVVAAALRAPPVHRGPPRRERQDIPQR